MRRAGTFAIASTASTHRTVTSTWINIPPGATINSATLRVNVNGTREDQTVTVHRAVTPWTEYGATWDLSDGSATWASGDFSSSDYDAASEFIERHSRLMQNHNGANKNST